MGNAFEAAHLQRHLQLRVASGDPVPTGVLGPRGGRVLGADQGLECVLAPANSTRVASASDPGAYPTVKAKEITASTPSTRLQGHSLRDLERDAGHRQFTQLWWPGIRARASC